MPMMNLKTQSADVVTNDIVSQLKTEFDWIVDVVHPSATEMQNDGSSKPPMCHGTLLAIEDFVKLADINIPCTKNQEKTYKCKSHVHAEDFLIPPHATEKALMQNQ